MFKYGGWALIFFLLLLPFSNRETTATKLSGRGLEAAEAHASPFIRRWQRLKFYGVGSNVPQSFRNDQKHLTYSRSTTAVFSIYFIYIICYIVAFRRLQIYIDTFELLFLSTIHNND